MPLRLPESPFFVPWSILHQRVFIDITEFTQARTTYPVLPWIGVILLGWGIGPWFGKDMDPAERISRLLKLGAGLLVGVRNTAGKGLNASLFSADYADTWRQHYLGAVYSSHWPKTRT